ncbi:MULTISPECIES: hypothetical protein [unclassified Corynebacterium]|uniref:hypothetical protein n=1 Tax=unclassified Corynebacterium TaxID=2624378 RepID=UPI0030A72405
MSASSNRSSTVSPLLAAIAFLCVIGMAILFVYLSNSDRMSKPQNINGDMLGPEVTESAPAYVKRADDSLNNREKEEAELRDPGAAGVHPKYWALVSFDTPGTTRTAAASVKGIEDLRVASMVVGPMMTRDLPEPVGKEQRLDVLNREMEIVYESSGLAKDDPNVTVNGLIVHADLATLRDIRDNKGVSAVEALPADAARGRFGIRPMLPSQEDGETTSTTNSPATGPTNGPAMEN